MKPLDRKSEIINVAAKLFKAKGYSAVTMRDIAQDMNIRAASLYNHITSKQEILVLIIIEIAKEFTQVMGEIVQSNVPTIDKLKRIIQLHIDITLRNPEAMACLNKDWMHLAESDLSLFIKMREDYETNFRIIIKKGIEDGELKNLNLDIVLFSMHATLRNLVLWYGKKKGFNPNMLKETMTKILLNGIV